jgi:YD repeat-containing protein
MKPIIVALAALVVMTGAALAQSRTLYDSSGIVFGRSTTDSQGTTTIYDASGRVIGRISTNSNGTTTIYGANGRAVGRSTLRK